MATDLITLLTDQHRDVELMFDELEDVAGQASEHALVLGRRVVIALVAHSVAEQVHLDPAVRERVNGGETLADREVAEHQQVERVMRDLEALHPDGPDFWPLTHRLIARVREHVTRQERDLFPGLRRACSDGELRALGDKARRSQRIGPTRPHPSAPSQPTVLEALAPATGLLDRIFDAARGRGA